MSLVFGGANSFFGIETPSAYTWSRVTNTVSTTDNTTGVSSGIAFNVVAGETYWVDVFFAVDSALATTGIQFTWIESNGATHDVACGEMTFAAGPTSTEARYFFDIGTSYWTGATGGVNVGTDNSPLRGRLLYKCTASGTITLWLKSEVSGSSVQINAGSCAKLIASE